jgi:hypothetical protein
MDMSTRVRRAKEALFTACAPVDVDTIAILLPIRAWLRDTLPTVSSKIRTALPAMRGIQMLMDSDPSTLPAGREAAREFLAAIGRNTSADPMTLVQTVETLAWNIAVFRLPDESCRSCQGNLELWLTRNGDIALVCDFLGCRHAGQGPSSTLDPAGLATASRADVLRYLPAAELLRA